MKTKKFSKKTALNFHNFALRFAKLYLGNIMFYPMQFFPHREAYVICCFDDSWFYKFEYHTDTVTLRFIKYECRKRIYYKKICVETDGIPINYNSKEIPKIAE